MTPSEIEDPRPKPTLCFDCAVRIGARGWPLVGLDGSSGIPDIPSLVKGLCPVCEGSKPLDPDDLEG
jgi:hypothetical protein